MNYYQGPIHAASLIIKEEGTLGLWKGAFPTVLRNGTNQMSLFFFKPLFDKILWQKEQGDGKALRTGQSLTSGFFAGIIGPCLTGLFFYYLLLNFINYPSLLLLFYRSF